MTKVITTDGVRPSERDAFWRHAMSRFLPVTITNVGEGTFEGSIRSTCIGRLIVAETRSTGQDLRRTTSDIRRSDGEYFHVAVVASGLCGSARMTGKLRSAQGTASSTRRSGPSSCFSKAAGTHALSRSPAERYG